MSISTFMYSFDTEGVYVFGDSANQLTSVTIIKVSKTLCNSTSGNIYPVTEENLKRLGIIPDELKL
jgi:hypothetical protein